MESTGWGERSVFAVSGRTFNWTDIVSASKAWGQWAECERAASVARLALDRANRTSARLDGPEFDAEQERFRRARRLLAADELVSWLSRRGVEVSAWRDYIRGEVLRRDFDGPISGGDLGAAVWVHAVCSGTLDAVAQLLAARAAVAGGLDRLGALATPLTEPDVAELDLIFMEFCERSATGTAIEREVEKRRLDWLVLEWRWQASADTDVLREAALCVRDDGLTFDDAAGQAGLKVQLERMTLDAAPPELHPHLLGARVGELLGPLPVGGEHLLIEVLDKRVPSIDDPQVRAAAHDAVVNRAVEAEVVDRVRWDERA